ncbi:MAG: nitrogenase molybdenum-iron protein subunit beta [Clostridiales bacterium]
MLDCTPKEYKDRKGLVVNPAKTCQPVGAMYAALGIHKCLPHSHGSQGCCAYHRKFLTRNFRDPVMASTSSFTEGASVFGGGSNLKTSIKNVFEIYNPDIIAVHTTCLSETIGDDIPSYLSQTKIPEGKLVIHANTPSYQGSHVTGFSNMVKGIVSYISENDGKSNDKVNVIPGFVNPGDMREIKRLTKLMNQETIMFPDTSGVLDAPLSGKFEMYPKGGAKISDIKDSGNSISTIALGKFASADGSHTLENKCKVPSKVLKTPIGIKATDDFISTLNNLTGKEVPYEIEEERGQLVDIMVDNHYHYHGKKVALFGDPDFVIAMTEFVISLGMIPKYVVTGTPGAVFTKEINEMLKSAGIKNSKVKESADLFTLHQWLKEEKTDLLIGGTHGKYIAKAEDIPFVRMGFPILDRGVHSYIPIVGYKGAMRIIELISNAILERQDRDAEDEDFELIM